MAKIRVLVCGATGFIGRNIAVALAQDPRYEVIGVHRERAPFSHPEISWVSADLTQPADVDRVVSGTDILIQAAATTSGSGDIVQRPYIHVADNAVMNSLVLRAAFDHSVRHFVFFSCVLMYPNSDTPLKETDIDANEELHPRYFGAGWTKLYIERMCEFYSRISDTRFTVLRHANVYGPHDKYDLKKSHVFGATVTKVMTARNGKVSVWGNGEERRDLIHVSDLIDAVKAALDNQTIDFGLYNIGSGLAITVNELVDRIIAASGRSLVVEHDLSKVSIDTSVSLDCSRAKDAFGWQPTVSLDEGIERTLKWYSDVYVSGNSRRS